MGIFAEKIFKFRSYTPIPFIVLMVIFQKASIESMLIGFTLIIIGEYWELAMPVVKLEQQETWAEHT